MENLKEGDEQDFSGVSVSPAIFKENENWPVATETLSVIVIKGKASRHLEEGSQMNRSYIQESLDLNSELYFFVLVRSVCYFLFYFNFAASLKSS